MNALQFGLLGGNRIGSVPAAIKCSRNLSVNLVSRLRSRDLSPVRPIALVSKFQLFFADHLHFLLFYRTRTV